MGFKGDSWAVLGAAAGVFQKVDKRRSHFLAYRPPKKLIFGVLFNKIHRWKLKSPRKSSWKLFRGEWNAVHGPSHLANLTLTDKFPGIVGTERLGRNDCWIRVQSLHGEKDKALNNVSTKKITCYRPCYSNYFSMHAVNLIDFLVSKKREREGRKEWVGGM